MVFHTWQVKHILPLPPYPLITFGIEFGQNCTISGVPRNFFRGGGSTNSVEDRGQRERGSGCCSPL